MNKKTKLQLKYILKAGLIMFFGLLLLKYIPMRIWGDDILFDASAHVTIAIFILYIIWFFIDQNKKWWIPFFIFTMFVLITISFQRISVNAHNDIGLLLGLTLSLVAIGFSQPQKIKRKIKF